MEKEKEYLKPDPEVARGNKTLDTLAEELGVDKPPARPVPVEGPELNPEHGKEWTVPKEHQIPLEQAADELKKK